MRFWLGLVGFLTAFMGALPWLDEYSVLPDILNFIPRGAPWYNVILIVLGIIVMYITLKKL